MKRVTITYTREDLNTPWYWQISGGLSPLFEEYINQNSDKIEQVSYVSAQGYKFIVVLTIADEQSFDDFSAMIAADIAPDYVAYCQENNITIESVTEDI
jgi:hypothetical protein